MESGPWKPELKLWGGFGVSGAAGTTVASGKVQSVLGKVGMTVLAKVGRTGGLCLCPGAFRTTLSER